MKRLLPKVFLLLFFHAFTMHGQKESGDGKAGMLRMKQYLSSGMPDSAAFVADKYMHDSTLNKQSGYWFYRGLIYKELFNRKEKGQLHQSPSREKAALAFQRALEMETDPELQKDIQHNLKYLAATYYNDAVHLLQKKDKASVELSINSYNYYIELMELSGVTFDASQQQIDFLNALGSAYSKLYENDKTALANEYYEEAKSCYLKVLALDSLQKTAKYNLVLLQSNYKLKQDKEESEKKDQEIVALNATKELAQAELVQGKLEKDAREKQFAIGQLEKEKMELTNKGYQTDLVLMQNEQAGKELQLNNQTQIKNFFFIASGMLLLLLGFVFYSFKRKQNDNKLLTTQKAQIERQHKDITDSINYARRIQRAILPHRHEIWNAFPQSFLLFRPKDIVSGDFYFFAQNEEKLFLAAVDCTGHGVPGGFMSMLGLEKLAAAVRRTNDPGAILAILNRGIRSSLRQSSEEEDATRDGMDIALCVVDKTQHFLEYAGANRPLWLIRNSDPSHLEEIKATKSAIGGLTSDQHVFQTHRLELQAGDTIYLATDGYADQFGKSDKKLMTKTFKQILISSFGKSMREQKEFLDSFIEEWKGEGEQMDDILVIGFRA